MTAGGDDDRKALRRALSDRFPRERGQLLPALHHVQHELGYLSDWAMEAVSRHLRVPNSEVYGAATSYTELSLSQPARHTLRVCAGLSCSINGATEMLDELNGESSALSKGDISVEETACGFLCGVAPAVQWNGRWIGRASVGAVSRLAAEAEGR
jgi:NADH:ubiquinone oxidoreductase subunit E